MKVRILFLAAAMTVAGMSALVAHADTVNDPVVKINKGANFGAGDPDFTSDTITEAFVPGGSSDTWTFLGGTPITDLFIDITGVPVGPPPEFFQCVSNIFAECEVGSEADGDPGGLTQTEVLYLFAPVPGVAATCQSDQGAGGTCPDIISYGDQLTVTIDTPEPSTIVLLLGALVPLFYFGRKRFASNGLSA